MCLTDPDIFKISDATFILNEAVSGGALSLVATEETTGMMHACQFENNKASYGGALYLSSGEGKVSIHRSNFSTNIAGESSSIGLFVVLLTRTSPGNGHTYEYRCTHYP